VKNTGATAVKRDRSLVQPVPAERGQAQPADPVLLFWSKLISSAAYEARKTRHGLPTPNAVHARWWIVNFKPAQRDRDAWETSFEAACSWLGWDADAERKRLKAEIDAALLKAHLRYATQRWRRESKLWRARVLACAGVETAIAGQLVLGLVSPEDFEDAHGKDHPDPGNAFLNFAPMETTGVLKTRRRKVAA
jgi:hypothetical protein